MKTISKILAAVVVLALANKSQAQSTANASATATIIQPIAISKTVDMNFGNVAVQSSTGGTVVLAPAGTRTKTGGVTLPVTAGDVAAATFAVTGDGDRTFTITLPSSATLARTGVGASETMTVNSFTSNPSGTGTLASGAATVNVGATLNVLAGQVPGTYTGNFDVTVNYN